MFMFVLSQGGGRPADRRDRADGGGVGAAGEIAGVPVRPVSALQMVGGGSGAGRGVSGEGGGKGKAEMLKC